MNRGAFINLNRRGQIMENKSENKTINSFTDPLISNKNEFKERLTESINEWDFPFIHAMQQKDFMTACELRIEFDKYKQKLIKKLEQW